MDASRSSPPTCVDLVPSFPFEMRHLSLQGEVASEAAGEASGFRSCCKLADPHPSLLPKGEGTGPRNRKGTAFAYAVSFASPLLSGKGRKRSGGRGSAAPENA